MLIRGIVRISIFILTLVAFKILMVNCTKDKAKEPEKVLDEAYCETLNLSFKDDVSQLIVKSCATSSCHSDKTKAGDLVLETYKQIKESAKSGSLSCAIHHMADCEPMPEGRKKFSQDKLEIVDCWILLGMPEN